MDKKFGKIVLLPTKPDMVMWPYITYYHDQRLEKFAYD